MPDIHATLLTVTAALIYGMGLGLQVAALAVAHWVLGLEALKATASSEDQ